MGPVAMATLEGQTSTFPPPSFHASSNGSCVCKKPSHFLTPSGLVPSLMPTLVYLNFASLYPTPPLHTATTIVIVTPAMFALRRARALVGTAAAPAAAARRRTFASSTPSGGENPWLNDKSVSYY